MNAKLALGVVLVLAGCLGPASTPTSSPSPSLSSSGSPTESSPRPDPIELASGPDFAFVEADIAGAVFRVTLGRVKAEDAATEVGRPAYFQVWNRTGKALYAEWPLETVSRTYEVVVPPDPPYLFHLGDAAVGVRSTAVGPRVPYIVNPSPDKEPYLGGIAATSEHVHRFAVEFGKQTAEAVTRIPACAYFIAHGLPEPGGSGVASVYDPQGRLSDWWEIGGTTGNHAHYWGDAPLPGAWKLQVNLTTPAVMPDEWGIHDTIHCLKPEARKLGFDWPDSMFDWTGHGP